MLSSERTSWKQFDDIVQYRQQTFRKDETKRQQKLKLKVAQQFSPYQPPRRQPSNVSRPTTAKSPKPTPTTRNFFSRFGNNRRQKSDLAKPATTTKKTVKQLHYNINPDIRSYHDEQKGDIFPTKIDSLGRFRNAAQGAIQSPRNPIPLSVPPHPPPPSTISAIKNPVGQSRQPRTTNASDKKSELTYYDKPIRFSVDTSFIETKPRSKYLPPKTSEIPKRSVYTKTPTAPISKPKKSNQPETMDRTRRPPVRIQLQTTNRKPSSSRAAFNDDRIKRILPRLEDTHSPSPRPQRSARITPRITPRRRSPSPNSRQENYEVFRPMSRTSIREFGHPSPSLFEDEERFMSPASPQKRAFLLSGNDGPSLSTRPSRTYRYNPGTVLDDKDLKTVIRTADSPAPVRSNSRLNQSLESEEWDNVRMPRRQPRRKSRGQRSHQQQQPAPGPPPPHPPLNTDEEDPSNEGFRYKRDLNSTSNSTHLPPIRRHDDDESVSNSASTFDLAESGARSSARGARTHSSQGTHARRTRSSHDDDDDDDDTQRSIEENEQNNYVIESHSDFYGRSGSWPIYRYRRNGGIVCMVRAAPGTISEVKRSLRLIDAGLSAHDQQCMPPLPAMEFDADEHVVLSPMQLIWEKTPNTTRNGRPTITAPIYVIMPVNATIFNDALQQMICIYTVDYRPWQYAEGHIIRLPVDGKLHDFYETVIREPFTNVIFDIKARYLENSRMIPVEGGEFSSTMENGVRVFVHKRTFDETTKVKLRVEPLDMNETELYNLIPGPHTQNAVAVSPIIKITAGNPTKRSITVFLPKPGTSVFGSTKLGLRNKLLDLRGVRVHLYTKDRQISKYQPDSSVKREYSNEYEFSIRIWKPGGSAYAFLVMTGMEPPLQPGLKNSEDEKDFLASPLFRRLSHEIEPDELKARAVARQLLSYSNANDIFRNHSDDVPLATFKILKRWKNTNKRLEEGAMVRQLVVALRESGFAQEALAVQSQYRQYLTDEEGKKMLTVFDELRTSPAVMVNWRMLGRVLGLLDPELEKIQNHSPDLRKRCYAVLRMAFEIYRANEEFYRDILLRYIAALQRIGCPRIAASIERRHVPKFYMDAL